MLLAPAPTPSPTQPAQDIDLGEALAALPPVVWLVVFAAVGVVVGHWVWALKNRPWVKCKRCTGVGQFFSWLMPWRWGLCPRCKGSRRQLAWSTRTFVPKEKRPK